MKLKVISNEFKIESNIPIPPREGGTGLAATMRKMKVGDSILVPAKMRNSVYGAAKRVKISIRVRADDAKQVIRVWRVAADQPPVAVPAAKP